MQEDSTSLDSSSLGLDHSYLGMAKKGPFLDQGLEGSPSKSISDISTPPMIASLGFESFEANFFDHRLERFHTDRPVTRLKYSQGEKELIYIEASHGQQISERLTLGIDYRRLKNQNFYYSNIADAERARFTNLFNAKAYVGFYTPNRRYEILAGMVWNKLGVIESGGLTDAEVFESFSGRAKLDNNPAALSRASNSLVEHSYILKQYFRPKSAGLDTNNRSDLSRFRQQWVLQSSFGWKRAEFLDESPDSLYYGLKLEELQDSLNHRYLDNELSYVVDIAKQRFSIGLQHRIDYFYQNELVWDYQSTYLQLAGRSGSLPVAFSLRYGLSGYNRSNYDIRLAYGATTGNWRPFAKLKLSSVAPYQTDLHFNSPVVQWANTSFSAIGKQEFVLGAKLKKGETKLLVAGRITGINHAIYLDSAAGPMQYQGSVSFSQFKLKFLHEFGPLGISIKQYVQQSSNAAVIPMPTLVSNGRIYLKAKLFKKRLHTYWGFSTTWFSSYRAQIYDPVVRKWRLEYADFERYPPISFFLNAEIKSFQFGASVYHIQEGLMGESYYSSPSYPIMPRVIRLNIQWTLAN